MAFATAQAIFARWCAASIATVAGPNNNSTKRASASSPYITRSRFGRGPRISCRAKRSMTSLNVSLAPCLKYPPHYTSFVWGRLVPKGIGPRWRTMRRATISNGRRETRVRTATSLRSWSWPSNPGPGASNRIVDLDLRAVVRPGLPALPAAAREATGALAPVFAAPPGVIDNAPSVLPALAAVIPPPRVCLPPSPLTLSALAGSSRDARARSRSRGPPRLTDRQRF